MKADELVAELQRLHATVWGERFPASISAPLSQAIDAARSHARQLACDHRHVLHDAGTCVRGRWSRAFCAQCGADLHVEMI